MLINSKVGSSSRHVPFFHFLQFLLFSQFMLFCPGLMELGTHNYITTLPIAAVIITWHVWNPCACF